MDQPWRSFVDGGWLTTADIPGDTLFREFVSSTTYDLDGDGLLDLLIPRDATGSWWLWHSDGDGTLSPLELPESPGWTAQLSKPTRALAAMDLDGDGLHDPAFWRHSGGTAANWDLWRHAGSQPDRIIRITDGLGQVVEIDYAALTDIHAEGLDDGPQELFDDCSWPHDCHRSPRVVVSQHRLDAGVEPGVFREFDHRYRGSRGHLLERRWLGFFRHTVTEHTWHQGQRLPIARRSVGFPNLSHDGPWAPRPWPASLERSSSNASSSTAASSTPATC
ncbi:MAG: hypothetical protein HC882_05645 [Acidobacteria bacterium]|nr:hypothetical protein [Acidobacteriota bacterium]